MPKMLKPGDEIVHNTEDDLSKIGDGPDENPSINAGIIFPEPSEGMLFDSWEQARIFYNDYAKHVGFSVRIQGGHKDTKGRGVAMKDRPFVTRLFVCSQEGFRRDRRKHDEDCGEHGGYQQMIKRTGCQAMLSVKKIKDSGQWTVVEFKKDHNHPMTSPEKIWHLRSHRRMFGHIRGAVGGASISIHPDFDPTNENILRFNDIIQESKNIAQDACESEKKYEMVMCRLKGIYEELASIGSHSVTIEPQGPKPKTQQSSILGELLDGSVAPRNGNILFSHPSSTKGGSSDKRPLSEIELTTSKGKKCKIRQKSDHNRSCSPMLNEGSNMSGFTTKESTSQELYSDDNNDEEPQQSLEIPEISPS